MSKISSKLECGARVQILKTQDTEDQTNPAWLPEETVSHPTNTKTAGPFALSTVNRERDQPDKLE